MGSDPYAPPPVVNRRATEAAMVEAERHAHELAVAQLEGAAAAAERLERACAGIEARLNRINAAVAAAESWAPVPVSRDQLRLVAG